MCLAAHVWDKDAPGGAMGTRILRIWRIAIDLVAWRPPFSDFYWIEV